MRARAEPGLASFPPAAHLAEALVLLTRIPVPWRFIPSPSASPWAFPVVGAFLGAATGATATLGGALGLPPALSAGWALAATLLLTGALHEDGLADTADGLGGGRTPERRLAIMRDSRIGSFGALALVLSTGLRWSALAAFEGAGQGTWRVVAASTAAGALARCAMLLPMRLPPARPDGLGASLGVVRPAAIAAGWAFGAALAFALLPAARAGLCLLLAAAAGLLLARTGRRALNGRTGDLLGATEQAAECAILTLLAR
ncbi:MAG: adenosylcobinamide-GDP ribazoletransferase [Janthinobacterium lividum]